ncbi:TonB-dependent receptor [Erythrobacter sp. QSSC1-22B]|uniref:TonB-dependent receptor plug domain-containing protein n=1 Tax=Erythrobacter sp. QSSC1-22B TaxID=1860125 RepID=UPI0008047E53|nr:TonB-dependent receptor [Erythrobacter sp. QSSC1-22B]OBX18230.1 TonB-dependent receptor [Erythrobacter sp. QSSC1-22B]
MNNHILIPAALCAACIAAPAIAQTSLADRSSVDANVIVITGTRSGDAIRVDQHGAAITTLDAEALEQRQTRSVSDALRDVPGVAVSRIAGQTQVRLRGSEANHVLVLIDGIEASDPYSGEFDFGTLPADAAARVEIVRGQQSAIYGSDAIGGVIQYITLTGREAPGFRARFEAGSFGTLNGAVRAAGVGGNLDYALSGTLNTTAGPSNARAGGRDLRSDTGAVSLKSSWILRPELRITAVGRYALSNADFNDTDNDPTSPSFGLIVDTPGARVRSEGLYGLLRGELDLFDNRWSHAVTAQIADTVRDGFNASGRSYGNAGTRQKGSYETTLRLGEGDVRHLLTAAFDAERERYRNTDPSGYAFTGSRSNDNIGLVGQYELLLGNRASLGASIRHDDNQRFAGSTTYRVQASYRLGNDTRLRGAAGSGVKNPGFYELFGYVDGRYIGNENLRPERSQGWEVGVEQSLNDGAVNFGATYFQSRLEDEIFTAYPAPSFIATPANSEEASRQRGVETYLNARLGQAWRIDAAYTYLHAREAGLEEVRRPPHIASIAVSWRAPGDRLSLTGVARYNGETDDLAFTDPSYVPVRERLDDYVLVNLNADFRLTEEISLFGRVENLFDERYEDVFSFTNPGVSAFVGLRARI